MRWLTNTYDPRRPDWAHSVITEPGKSHCESVYEKRCWLDGKVIGEPKATDTYGVAELKAVGMVGIYAPEEAA